MCLRLASLAFLLSVCFPDLSAAQQTSSITVQRDQQALTVLAQVLKTAGGEAAINAIRDITASGTITYYWAGEEVQGTVTVKGRGTSQFRLDATLAKGVRSWTVNNGIGSIKEPDGTTTPIEHHNTVNAGNLTFPLAHLVAALQDSSTAILYIGLETREGQQVHHLREWKAYSPDSDPSGMRSRLTRKDFFVDPDKFVVVGILDMLHPKNRSNQDSPHEVRFSDYRLTNGVLVPFSITEIGVGQRISTIQFSQITFNSDLRDTDFDL